MNPESMEQGLIKRVKSLSRESQLRLDYYLEHLHASLDHEAELHIYPTDETSVKPAILSLKTYGRIQGTEAIPLEVPLEQLGFPNKEEEMGHEMGLVGPLAVFTTSPEQEPEARQDEESRGLTPQLQHTPEPLSIQEIEVTLQEEDSEEESDLLLSEGEVEDSITEASASGEGEDEVETRTPRRLTAHSRVERALHEMASGSAGSVQSLEPSASTLPAEESDSSDDENLPPLMLREAHILVRRSDVSEEVKRLREEMERETAIFESTNEEMQQQEASPIEDLPERELQGAVGGEGVSLSTGGSLLQGEPSRQTLRDPMEESERLESKEAPVMESPSSSSEEVEIQLTLKKRSLTRRPLGSPREPMPRTPVEEAAMPAQTVGPVSTESRSLSEVALLPLLTGRFNQMGLNPPRLRRDSGHEEEAAMINLRMKNRDTEAWTEKERREAVRLEETLRSALSDPSEQKKWQTLQIANVCLISKSARMGILEFALCMRREANMRQVRQGSALLYPEAGAADERYCLYCVRLLVLIGTRSMPCLCENAQRYGSLEVDASARVAGLLSEKFWSCET